MAQFFFTSCAATENRAYAARFHADLLKELQKLTGAPVSAALRTSGGTAPRAAPSALPAGTGTAGCPGGVPKPAGAARTAAATAAVMVALCSDAYYADPQCGLDWALFDQRLRLRRAALPGTPEPRVLVRWRPVDPPHGLPRPPFHSGDVLGDYARIGLYGIMHGRGLGAPAYAEAVRQVARCVQDARKAAPPALPEVAAALLVPAFPLRRPPVSGLLRPPDLPPHARPAAVPAPGGRLFYISYAAPDLRWARWVEFHVRKLGHRTEMDVYDWQPGSDAGHHRSQALRTADRVIALFSRAYFRVTSPTLTDWSDAFQYRGEDGSPRLVPLLIEDVALPAGLRGLVTAELTGLDTIKAQQVLAAAVSGQGTHERPCGEPPLPRS